MRLIIEQVEIEVGDTKPGHTLTRSDSYLLAFWAYQYIDGSHGNSKPTVTKKFASILECSLETAEKILRLHASTVRASENGIKLGDIVPCVELTQFTFRRLRELIWDYTRSTSTATDRELITQTAQLCGVIPEMAKWLLEMNTPSRVMVPN